MKSIAKFIVLLGLVTNIALCETPAAVSNERTIDVIGLDDNGQEVSIPVGTKGMQKKLTSFMTSVEKSVAPEMEKFIKTDKKFKLTKFDIGFSLKAALGIGILSASAEPSIAFRFAK
mgnify:CR=1 FL=1